MAATIPGHWGKEKPPTHVDGHILPCDFSRPVQRETGSTAFGNYTAWTASSWHSISCFSLTRASKTGALSWNGRGDLFPLFLSEQQKAHNQSICFNLSLQNDFDKSARLNSLLAHSPLLPCPPEQAACHNRSTSADETAHPLLSTASSLGVSSGEPEFGLLACKMLTLPACTV